MERGLVLYSGIISPVLGPVKSVPAPYYPSSPFQGRRIIPIIDGHYIPSLKGRQVHWYAWRSSVLSLSSLYLLSSRGIRRSGQALTGQAVVVTSIQSMYVPLSQTRTVVVARLCLGMGAEVFTVILVIRAIAGSLRGVHRWGRWLHRRRCSRGCPDWCRRWQWRGCGFGCVCGWRCICWL